MPITPFHFGPGALIKVIAPRHFSWTIFALANILIDLEPVTLFLLIADPAHPWLHTLPGAIAVAAAAALFGRKPCEGMLAWWNRQLSSGLQRRWLAVEMRITRNRAWLSGLIGTFSHMGLDSIMHTDVEALWPLISGNSVQGLDWLSLLVVWQFAPDGAPGVPLGLSDFDDLPCASADTKPIWFSLP